MLRKFGLAVALSAMLIDGSASAADLPIKIPRIPVRPFFFVIKTTAPRVTGAGVVGAGAVGSLAVGFLGVVATMCAYDLYLKIEGVKNWDGTPNVAQPHKHSYHTA
jgi:hypothetical protein